MFDRYTTHALWENPADIPFTLPADATTEEHYLNHDGGIDRIGDIVRPSVTWYPVSGSGPHPAVLVSPGGAYKYLAYNHEGQDICHWFNSIGFSACLLKYRCPDRREAAHADAARAIRWMRFHAAELNISPDRIGAMGFSAGAHLTATLGAYANPVPYEPKDAIDQLSWKPNFLALIYPAYLADMELNIAPEFRIDAEVPPTFLLQAEDDAIQVETSLAWYLALKRAGVPAEMHLYAKGGHGYGMLRRGNPINNWGALATRWFQEQAGI